MKINEFLDFLKFAQKFRSTKRAIYSVGDDRMENDVEHCYQLAIMVWYVIEKEQLKLDTNLAIKYALIHDLEEAFNGDIDIFDTEKRKVKEQNEIKAMKKIIRLFPSWTSYKKLSLAYKAQKDEESRLVNGIDKILPVLNIYLDNGRTWNLEGRTLNEIAQNKREKTKVHPFSSRLWKEVERTLVKNK